MAKLSLSIFPKKSLITVCIYIGVLIAFIFLIIIPTQRESEALDKRIIELNTRIEEQKILKPIYQSLQKKAELTPPKWRVISMSSQESGTMKCRW